MFRFRSLCRTITKILQRWSFLKVFPASPVSVLPASGLNDLRDEAIVGLISDKLRKTISWQDFDGFEPADPGLRGPGPHGGQFGSLSFGPVAIAGEPVVDEVLLSGPGPPDGRVGQVVVDHFSILGQRQFVRIDHVQLEVVLGYFQILSGQTLDQVLELIP